MTAAESVVLRCSACRTKNRVPAQRLDTPGRCGKCAAPLDTAALRQRGAVMVSDANFDALVMRSPLPVLVYAWAPWCGTCQSTGPIIERFAREAGGRVRVAKLNIDASPATASRYAIMSVPFLFIFDAGELKESLPGGMPLHELMARMGRYLY
jgi:thioredoxin 2